MLADEPIASLDIYSELQLLKAVKLNHNKSKSGISILISHRMADQSATNLLPLLIKNMV